MAKQARARLLEAYPNLQIVGCLSPEVSPLLDMDHETVLRDIECARPDILLVAFGNPKQEKWIRLHRDRLQNVPVCIGVGGTFDFIAGSTRRAPYFMQQMGLEWLHRLAREPRRLARRYVRDLIQFPCLFARQLGMTHRRCLQAETRIDRARTEDAVTLSIVGPLTADSVPELQRSAGEALDLPAHLILDFSGVPHMDGAGLGALINLTRRADRYKREIRIVGANHTVSRLLHLTCADEILRICPTIAAALAEKGCGGLEVQTAICSDEAVYTVSGHASADQSALVEERLCSLPPYVCRLDLDLRRVTYIDSGMLITLCRCAMALRAENVRIRIVPGPIVGAVLAREQIANRFELADHPSAVCIGVPLPPIYRERQHHAL